MRTLLIILAENILAAFIFGPLSELEALQFLAAPMLALGAIGLILIALLLIALSFLSYDSLKEAQACEDTTTRRRLRVKALLSLTTLLGLIGGFVALQGYFSYRVSLFLALQGPLVGAILWLIPRPKKA